jgi:hypothetical protein
MAAPMAGIGIGASILQGIVGATSALWEGAAQSKMYSYQAGIARQRAQVAETESRFATTAGETNAMIQGLRTGQQVGVQRAGQGAANINPATGSAAAVRASQTWGGQTAESITRTNAARQAYGYDVQAATERAQASAYDVSSKTAITASYFNAGASVLGAASGVSSKWVQAAQAGVPGFGSSSDTNPTGQQYLGG